MRDDRGAGQLAKTSSSDKERKMGMFTKSAFDLFGLVLLGVAILLPLALTPTHRLAASLHAQELISTPPAFLRADLCLTWDTDQAPEQSHDPASCLICLISPPLLTRAPGLPAAGTQIATIIGPEAQDLCFPDRFCSFALARAPPHSCAVI